MFDWLADLIGYVEMAWELVLNFITAIGTFFEMLQQSLSLPFGIVVYLPSVIGASVLGVVSISVVKVLLGR